MGSPYPGTLEERPETNRCTPTDSESVKAWQCCICPCAMGRDGYPQRRCRRRQRNATRGAELGGQNNREQVNCSIRTNQPDICSCSCSCSRALVLSRSRSSRSPVSLVLVLVLDLLVLVLLVLVLVARKTRSVVRRWRLHRI